MSKQTALISVGQCKDLVSALAQGVPADLLGDDAQYWIGNKTQLHDELARLLRRQAQLPPIFARDMRKEGWTLLEDAPRRINSATNLELVPFLKEGEPSVGGEKLVSRARTLRANYGQHDAEWILEHQGEIPEEFREFVLVFTETVWRDDDGDRDVAVLGWGGERWELGFDWLDFGFGGGARLVRPRES